MPDFTFQAFKPKIVSSFDGLTLGRKQAQFTARATARIAFMQRCTILLDHQAKALAVESDKMGEFCLYRPKRRRSQKQESPRFSLSSQAIAKVMPLGRYHYAGMEKRRYIFIHESVFQAQEEETHAV